MSAHEDRALTPKAIATGAVVDASGESVIAAIESWIDESAAGAGAGDARAVAGIPVLRRGEASIVPLSWESPESEASPFEQQEISRRANALWTEIGGACRYRHGNQIGIDLSSPRGSYAHELARTGARRADWWAFGDRAVVLVVYGAPIPAPKTLIGVQVVPRSWVWDDAARDEATATDLHTGDLGWSWADAVDAADGR
jgi:hypothetical protein